MLERLRRALAVACLGLFFFSLFLQASNLHAQSDAAAAFKLEKVDLQVLADVNEFDRMAEKKGLVLHDPDLDAYLADIGKRVIGSRPIPEQVEFKFKVMRDPMVNAFALPNGTVYVNTGLLALLENEDQLAAVLGHETSHVFDRHGYLENRSVRKKVLALNIVQGVAAAVPGGANLTYLTESAQVFCVALQVGAALSSQILVSSIYGYSRDMERQADSDGLAALVSANYAPAAMVRSFELMDSDRNLEFEPIQGFYHDHPKLSERRSAALVFATSHPVNEARTGSEQEYLKRVSAAITYNIGTDANNRRARTAIARALRLTKAFPDEPRYQVLLADAYCALGAKSRVPSESELSHHGQAEDRKMYFKLTDQEEQNQLRKTPEGEALLRENLSEAEKLYLDAVQRYPTYAEAHRGLGFYYERQARYSEAAGEYQRYLDMVAGTSIDRLRMERRLASVEKLANPQPPPQQQQQPPPQPK